MNGKYQKIKEFRDKGLTYRSLSRLFGLSRQRIHQIVSGYNSDFSPDEKKIRGDIFKRDSFKCQWGKYCKKNNKKLLIHHIDFNNQNNNSNNLIVLCPSCHLAFHSRNHINPSVESNLKTRNYGKRKRRNKKYKKVDTKKAERGRKGGKQTLAKYGAKHFSELAKSKKGMKYNKIKKEDDDRKSKGDQRGQVGDS